MSVPITVPRLGWNMEHGVFVGWLKREGEPVQPGEPIFSLESEKSTEEVECLDAGILRIAADGPKAGDVVAVGTVIGHLVGDSETPPVTYRPEAVTHQPEAVTYQPAARAWVAAPSSPALRAGKEKTASPRARRVAAELGVAWETLTGSGKTGRIRERDVRAAAPVDGAPPADAALSATRRTIAERMQASHRDTAPVTLTTTADASNLVNLREQAKAATAAGNDFVPSYSDVLVLLAALALERHPRLNASWIDGRIVQPTSIHIGLAVDTDDGLLVPVLHDVPAMGLRRIAARSRELVERARQRRLSGAEMRGGTFTITNLGAFGIDAFTPIVNLPQCAILGVGRIGKQPAVVAGQIVPRDVLTLSLTFDHRIVDGAPAAKFLQTLTTLIENPGPWLLS